MPVTTDTQLSVPVLAGKLAGLPAPELAPDLELDVRSDVYSACAAVYELLTGHPLFHHTTGSDLSIATKLADAIDAGLPK